MIDSKLNSLNPRIGSLDSNPDRTRADRPEGKLGEEFSSALKNLQTEKTAKANVEALAPSLKLSNHALERVQSRGIKMTPDLMTRMEAAVKTAEGKGAKEMLVLGDEAAFIVSVKNKTIVTAMDKASMKENVFTNIDSTVMI